jgi:ubiquitin conjugation factor E4 B
LLTSREAYFQGQEHSAAGFLSLAIEILDFLIKILENGYSLFIRSEEMLQKLVSMLIYFFGKLCGPQMKNLNVKNPEKYRFNPKTLLGKIASIAVYFAHSEEMVTKMSAYAFSFLSFFSVFFSKFLPLADDIATWITRKI